MKKLSAMTAASHTAAAPLARQESQTYLRAETQPAVIRAAAQLHNIAGHLKGLDEVVKQCLVQPCNDSRVPLILPDYSLDLMHQEHQELMD